tara:strand:- start:1384 stop:2220 length:837 start_codon:yes stop_codon:yes gene_type:complete
MKAELYNNYSKELIKKIPRGSTVMYKLSDIQPDPDNEGRFLIPAYRNVPSTDEIYDPVSDDYVQIAYITNVKADGEAVLGEINFTRMGGGCIVLNGNNPTHQKIYQYLELSNSNLSNKNRVTSKTGFFKKADEKADAISERKERKMILEAMQKASNLNTDDVKFVASSLGMKLNKSEDELRNDVEEFAEFNPEDFLNITLQQTNRTESLVREAVDLRIITHNQKSAKFVWRESKKDIFTYKKKIGVKPFYEIAEYLQTENQEELEAIESRVLARRDNP